MSAGIDWVFLVAVMPSLHRFQTELQTNDTRNMEHKMAKFDFSHLNLEYLIQARDLARHSPRAGAVMLGIPTELAAQLAKVTPEGLALVTQFKPPLVAPRLTDWWWERLLRALTTGDRGELQVILEHAGLLGDA